MLASLYTFADGYNNPISALRKTFVYLEYHGVFVLKLIAVFALTACLGYAGAKTTDAKDFPKYPLRWYGALTVGSIIVSLWLRPEGDNYSPFFYYEGLAYYTGTVIASHAGLFTGAGLGRHSVRES